MQTSPLQIGAIDLQDFEVPSSIQLGGRHRVIVHKLSGGGRVLERLGPDEGDIHFSGTFSGPYAEARMRAMNNLRLTGEVVWLTWESFRYRVIVRTFVASFHNPWWISYQVSCVIVDQPGVDNFEGLSAGALVAADLAYAAVFVFGAGIQLDALQSAVAAPNALTAGTSDQSQAVAAVKSSLVTINERITQSSSNVGSTLATGSDALAYRQALDEKVASAGTLAAAVMTKAYVGRIGKTLTSAGGSVV